MRLFYQQLINHFKRLRAKLSTPHANSDMINAFWGIGGKKPTSIYLILGGVNLSAKFGSI